MKHTDQGQAGHKGLLARWLDSIMESRMRHVQHELDQHLPLDQRAKIDRPMGVRGDDETKPH